MNNEQLNEAGQRQEEIRNKMTTKLKAQAKSNL